MNQTIKIDENSRIKCEEDNYTLEYRVKKGDFQGKKWIGFKWEIGGFFPTLESLVNDWVLNAPSHSKSSILTMKELVECIQNAEKHIAKLIKGK